MTTAAAHTAAAIADEQIRNRAPQGSVPLNARHLVRLFLLSALGLAVAAVARLMVIVSGAVTQDDPQRATQAVSLADRLGIAATRLGPMHGLLLLTAIVCAALAAAGGRGDSRSEDRLAGWICGIALAAGFAGVIGAILGVQRMVGNGHSFSSISGDVGDLAGLGVTSLVAMWAGWRASDPNG